MYRWEILAALAEQKVFGIVRADSREAALATAEAMIDAGLRTLEIALTTPGGLSVIEELAGREGITLGAGTVLDETSARLATLAGAEFLVSPSLHPEVVRTAHRYGAAALPGVASPTEIVTALEHGADAVKLFPARGFGPRWLADVRAALPQAPVLPTGGVALEDVPAWVEAGAVACGIGSALTEGGPARAAQRVRTLVTSLG
ncbi:2-dehydro-3-deoxyphosphogluconate aldolase/(4S)-4-hydroxy-2-oxoglutarate aldolase [Crossiella equi]|uniref:2-dehydro-3-deoxyphosphogluconate aldolase/(4S)-4-hydroxy-2-oxoglutarate aldolase n=1 Tax=Crossiella equi TaxID=130796 RepID=A0ABS5AHG2_9PSEU|nr:bifunctional 4-hydroxy-2-oxoglutarate aldolase/2-dehydro-3-deoxy-phosphogluconate aldolase [Crossiella equi]MBP2475806.1 2-dehydro-3-deoxyphosphogluconate aldolase/(4S)-4-hydroxy-2-oxoglutarate aldolase [Crossiella equi]